MKNILVAVDFSMSCYNAFRYGLHLAEATGRNVVLAHYYVDPFYHKENVPTEEGANFGKAYIRRLEQFIIPANHLLDFDYEDPPQSVKISFECEPARSPVKAIVQRAQRNDIDLVVLGTITSQVDITKWYGSISIRVSSKCERPVFLIPPKAKFAEIKRIVVANAHEVAEPYALWQIKGIADLYQAKVHFVHVDKPDAAAVIRFIPWRLMSELADKEPRPGYRFTVASVEDEDLTQGILQYAGEINANLLIMINRLEDKIGKLVHESLTQDIALRSKIPLVILHTENNYEPINSVSAIGHFKEV